MKSLRARQALAVLFVATATSASCSLACGLVRSPGSPGSAATTSTSSWSCSDAPCTWTMNRTPDSSCSRPHRSRRRRRWSHRWGRCRKAVCMPSRVRIDRVDDGNRVGDLRSERTRRVPPTPRRERSRSGAVVSTTWTMKPCVSVFPMPSVAVHDTVVHHRRTGARAAAGTPPVPVIRRAATPTPRTRPRRPTGSSPRRSCRPAASSSSGCARFTAKVPAEVKTLTIK